MPMLSGVLRTDPADPIDARDQAAVDRRRRFERKLDRCLREWNNGMSRKAPSQSDRVREAHAGRSEWAVAVLPDGRGVELRIPKTLESPNKDRGHHWSKKHRATKGWEAAIAILGGGRLAPLRLVEEERAVRTRRGYELKVRRRKERRRVVITRYVAHARQLLSDDDNRRYLSKPINDALKRLALIYDDRREWLEHPEPTQEVSTDATDYTVIRIERLV